MCLPLPRHGVVGISEFEKLPYAMEKARLLDSSPAGVWGPVRRLGNGYLKHTSVAFHVPNIKAFPEVA
jgi:hypothetical protein